WMRRILAGTDQSSYDAVVDALGALRERVPETKLAVSYLVPTRVDWVDELFVDVFPTMPDNTRSMLLYSVNTPAQFDQLVAHNRAVGEDCLRTTGPLLEHVDTISVARDLEALRVGLGDEKLNFLGLSYGTLIGNIYANMYPRNIRAMVLDGPLDHTVGSARMVSDENATSEVALQHFFTWCEQEPSCELHTNVRAAYARFLRMSEGPLPAPGIPGGSTTGEVARQGVYAMLNIVSYRPALATAIKQAVAGDASELAKVATNGPDSDENPTNVLALQAYTAISCHDFPTDITTFPQLRHEIVKARRVAPDIDGHVESWQIQA
ncbi:alpha/beta fold hydrolase, partial [Kibdelosporangium lantanae]